MLDNTVSISASANPTPTPSVPEFNPLILAPLLSVVLLGVIAFKVKSKRVDGL